MFMRGSPTVPVADGLQTSCSMLEARMGESVKAIAPPAGRLLLVDDEESILRSIQPVLRRENWEIETATNAQRGLAVFKSVAQQVVLSDFRIHVINARDFWRQIE